MPSRAALARETLLTRWSSLVSSHELYNVGHLYEAADATPVNGYARIKRTWHAGDAVTLDLEMPARRVRAHAMVKADRDRFAVERGPLVYCAEGVDNGGKVLERMFPGPVGFTTEERTDLLGGTTVLRMTPAAGETQLTLIPYHLWCHRGPNPMRVWFPFRSEIKTASHCGAADNEDACFDGVEPRNSGDLSVPRFTWWDHRGTAEWVVKRFERPTRVSGVAVYWFDDTGTGECRVPAHWKLLYRDGEEWKPVVATGDYAVARDQYNKVTFAPVTTAALRIEAQLQPGFSGGVLEWKWND